jgi:3-oxoacyl-[acyl-carrier protein] reductase
VEGLFYCRKFAAMKDNKLAWIVGGSRGIGYACAEALAGEGYDLALSGRDEAALKEAAARMTTKGVGVISVVCDIAIEEQVKTAYKAIVEHFGRMPDVLINSAGISPWSTFSETTIEEFDQTIATNTRGMFLTSREVLRDMYEKSSGTIVQILSVASVKAYKNGAAYVASKFAAHGFTNSLREEARAHGVRVIAVFPGATETEIWDEESRAKNHKRMMQPEDIAEAIVYALKSPNRALVEEIILRPIQGDI